MLKNLLTNPGKFKYYNGGKGSTSTPLVFGQKTIPFGKDRPGGGDSNQPYIISSIPNGITNNGIDFLNRGGSKYLEILKDNISRLEKLINDPKNPAFNNFITKQNLLFQQQSKLPSSIYPVAPYNTNNIILNTSDPNTGIHFGGKGNNPLGILIPTNRYDYQTKSYYNDNDNNRLMLLYSSKLGGLIKASAKKFNINISSNDILFSYIIGPNGPLTNYKRSVNTTNWSNSSDYKNKFLVWDPQTLIGLEDDRVYSKNKSPFKDFRENLPNPNTNTPASQNNTSTNYINWNRTKTYGLGDPGKSGLNRTDFSRGIPADGGLKDARDELNTYNSIYSSGSVKNDLKNKDLVPFYISVLNPDSPKIENFIHFRAFLEGGISDAFSAEWNEIKYMGRGEKFYKYNGFTRDISLQFKVHAQSKNEMPVVYDKLNYLASLMAPNYSNSGLMRGNIIKLTIGNYLNETPGILKGFTFTIDENYPWDIGRDIGGNPVNDKLPTIISVNSFQFTPIHSFLPKTDQNAKFISAS